MAGGASGSADEVTRLARGLASWTWPRSEAASIAGARDDGWSVIDDRPGQRQLFWERAQS